MKKNILKVLAAVALSLNLSTGVVHAELFNSVSLFTDHVNKKAIDLNSLEKQDYLDMVDQISGAHFPLAQFEKGSNKKINDRALIMKTAAVLAVGPMAGEEDFREEIIKRIIAPKSKFVGNINEKQIKIHRSIIAYLIGGVTLSADKLHELMTFYWSNLNEANTIKSAVEKQYGAEFKTQRNQLLLSGFKETDARRKAATTLANGDIDKNCTDISNLLHPHVLKTTKEETGAIIGDLIGYAIKSFKSNQDPGMSCLNFASSACLWMDKKYVVTQKPENESYHEVVSFLTYWQYHHDHYRGDVLKYLFNISKEEDKPKICKRLANYYAPEMNKLSEQLVRAMKESSWDSESDNEVKLFKKFCAVGYEFPLDDERISIIQNVITDWHKSGTVNDRLYSLARSLYIKNKDINFKFPFVLFKLFIDYAKNYNQINTGNGEVIQLVNQNKTFAINALKKMALEIEDIALKSEIKKYLEEVSLSFAMPDEIKKAALKALQELNA